MNKDLVKAALIGLAAGVCLSAQMVPSSKEVAMGRCTKPANPDDDEGDEDCAGSCKHRCNSSDASSEIEVHRKSAARKVLEGE